MVTETSALVAALSLLLSASSAADLPPLTGNDVRVQVDSSASKELRFYPEAAQRAHIEGIASVLCTITADGRLSDCTTAVENPPGYGFAAATVRLASHMRVAPRAKDGSPTVGRSLRVDMAYKLPR
jgi:TonB family protein